MPIRAYIRVSTDEQAQEGFSLATQQRRIADYVRAVCDGAPAVHWYADEGWSAKNMDRPALGRLRAEARPGDMVIVLRLDRLTRSVGDLYALLGDWSGRSISLRSVTESFNTDTSEGRFMLTLLASLAQWERERNAERVREVMANIIRTDRRHLSRPPLGFDLAAKQLVVNAQEAELVRTLFDLYLRGEGVRRIAARLNRQGLRTKQGAEWTDFAVTYTLRNPIYAGQVAWGRIVAMGRRRDGGAPPPVLVAGAHEPIVPPAVWQAAQERLGRGGARREAAPRGRGPAPGLYPLSGLARCGLCGGPLHGFVQRRYRDGAPQPGKERLYYRCSRRNHRENCKLPYLQAERLEAAVLHSLGLLAPPAVLAEVARTLAPPPSDAGGRELAALHRELAQLARRQSRWDEAYSDGALSLADWRERTEAIRQRQAALQARAGALVDAPAAPAPTPAAIAAVLADLPRVWPVLTPAERRTVLHGLLAEIVVADDGTVTVVPLTYGG